MQDPAFAAPGTFLRGNLHCHSNRSDGALNPEEVCARYRAAGYDFIALTDHFVGRYGYPLTATECFRSADFTTIIGAELHSGAMANGELWHILAVGLPPSFAPSNSPDFRPVADQETGAQIAARARAAGAFVAIAHPEWSGLLPEDARAIDAAHAVEVYNHSCRVESDRPHGFMTLDHLLNEGRRLTLCATDDAHFKDADAFGGWVMVKAEENTPDALLRALKAGQFYASTGPQLHDVVWDGDRVHVKCSPASSVIVMGRGSATAAVQGEGMTQVSVDLGKVTRSPWRRLAIVDAAGNRAWCNPHWIA